MARSRADVLLVSLGSTGGLRAADEELAASMARAGARVDTVRAGRPPELRTLALTDLSWALAARRASAAGLLRANPRAVLYSSTTAALLWPRPGAIRFDALAAGNRPGRHGVWQRPAERRRLEQAPVLVPWSEQALDEAPRPGAPAVVVPVPVDASGPAAERDIAAVTYGAHPEKKGLDRVLAAWRLTRGDGERMVVAGLDRARAMLRLGAEAAATPGVDFAGTLARPDYRALLRRSRAFVCAPRREDYGLAQLEALADGCLLVTSEAPGPYAALPIARNLDARLVGDGLAQALRIALDDPAPGYAARAREQLAPWRPQAVDAVVAERLLPALLD